MPALKVIPPGMTSICFKVVGNCIKYIFVAVLRRPRVAPVMISSCGSINFNSGIRSSMKANTKDALCEASSETATKLVCTNSPSAFFQYATKGCSVTAD
ncbi:hypothetical protein DPMN_033694 [Dreissena polymorpha]|uniref:Uncharacterized protein n=1 Tax=Dreissena polymorpha TaxID=45954 RepID=A0A9D4M8T5_DREPO|nr:hypothetical protein DPMN_033694 [Dreissena polymorpha]